METKWYFVEKSPIFAIMVKTYAVMARRETFGGERKELQPKVSNHAEFFEIANDFGNPLEVLREAIANAFDWRATYIKIKFSVEQIHGYDCLVIEFQDDGAGMSYEALANNFWDLGNSLSRADSTKIGEKGHGTKIYLRSQKVIVRTYDGGDAAYESVCENAFARLSSGQMHVPRIRKLDSPIQKGTFIRIEGYNNSVQTNYTQLAVKDYILWFTKMGSFELELPNRVKPDFHVELQCLDQDTYESIPFGHVFPRESKDINALFEQYAENAAEHFAKRYAYFDQRLKARSDIAFDVVIYVEGNAVKNEYNPLLRKRKDALRGSYKVSDRYGLWLCKDFIPIQNINTWITGFGTGSNSATLLHGFINCQKLKLTANRGTVANTDPIVTEDLKTAINEILSEIEADLYKNKNFDTLQQWQQESKTLSVEAAQFESRKKAIKASRWFEIGGRKLLEPRNESELFGVFISLYSLYPMKFDFEPLDYDTKTGIDIIARNKTEVQIADCEFWYIELKKTLSQKQFNHSFRNIRWIICWDIASDVRDGTILSSVIANDEREFKIHLTKSGRRTYFLDDPNGNSSVRIRVLALKEWLKDELQVELQQQP